MGLTWARSRFSYSSSCRRKPRFGLAQGLAALTAARQSTQPRLVTVMRYATTRVTLRDTPATLEEWRTESPQSVPFSVFLSGSMKAFYPCSCSTVKGICRVIYKLPFACLTQIQATCLIPKLSVLFIENIYIYKKNISMWSIIKTANRVFSVPASHQWTRQPPPCSRESWMKTMLSLKYGILKDKWNPK